MSLEVNDGATNSTGSQSNSTTEVGGTQSRSTVSADEFAKMFAFCLATAMQHPLSPAVFQEPTRTDQSGTRFPLNQPFWERYGCSAPGSRFTRHFSVPPLEYKNLTSYKKYRPEFGLNIQESKCLCFHHDAATPNEISQPN